MELINGIEVVRIGNQIWQKENLKVDKYRNGESILQITDDEEWEQRKSEGKSAFCHYNNDPLNSLIFGNLYNWWAVNDTRGLAPEGFRIPLDKDWNELVEHLGGFTLAQSKLKNTSGWKRECNGNNESGFSAVPNGQRSLGGGFDSFDNDNSYWWSLTESNIYMSSYWNLYFLDWDVNQNISYKWAGMSVRCILDN
jgi:uncharacterized protein (TIGR02145 family)